MLSCLRTDIQFYQNKILKDVKEMVYIIITNKFPATKAKEVGKTYLEQFKKYPPDKSLETQVFRGAIKSDEDGITTIGITEPKEGKMKEFLRRLADGMAMYHDIEGFKYKIEVWYNVFEAMEVLGMKAPE